MNRYKHPSTACVLETKRCAPVSSDSLNSRFRANNGVGSRRGLCRLRRPGTAALAKRGILDIGGAIVGTQSPCPTPRAASDRASTVGVVIAVLVALLALAGCRPNVTPAPAPEPPEMLSIFYTCDTRGHISPCNCAAGIAGGIARRKTYIDENRSPDSIIVDAGDVTAGPREWELLELEYILKGYEAIGYDAVNIGAREASFPVETLRELREQHAFFVSANVQDEQGNLIFHPYRIRTLSNGYRFGIVGVVQDSLLPDEIGRGVRIVPAVEAIARVLPDIQEESDFIVLLAFANETAMKAIAERFFEIDAIIGGDVEQPSGEPLLVNRSIVAYNTGKGKGVGWLDLRFVDGQAVVAQNTVTLLLEHVADDSDMAALVKDLHVEQVRNNYPTEKDDEEGLSRIPEAG